MMQLRIRDLSRNVVRILVPSIIVLGYLVSAPIFEEERFQYLLLNIVSFAAAAVATHILMQRPSDYAPQIILLIALLFGYFVKFYILCLMFLNIDVFEVYMSGRFPLELEIFRRDEFVFEYFLHITIYIVVLAVFAVVCSAYLPNRGYSVAPLKKIPLRIQLVGWGGAGVVAIAVLSAIWYFQIGTPAATGAPPLPFRLAGVIQAANTVFLPMVFLSLVMASETSGRKYFSVFAVVAFAIHGMATGLITTSRVPVATVWISLLLMWVIQQRLTVRRIVGLAVTLPLVLGYGRLLGMLRIAPSSGWPLSPGELTAVPAGSAFDTFGESGESGVAQIVLQLTDVVLRIGGADSYLNIISANIYRSLAESVTLLVGVPESATQYFNREVLGYDLPQIGTSFSPSLLGYFYIISPSVLFVSLLLFLFLTFWQFVYFFLRSRFMVVGPAALAVLLVTLALYASEGTLESLPQRLAIIAVSGALIEATVRLLMRTSKGTMQ